MSKKALAALYAVGLLVSGLANAAVFTFDTDPFAGSDALTTPFQERDHILVGSMRVV